MFIRHLDIDDLIVLSSLLDEQPLWKISRKLGVTPPALSHRLNKYRVHIPDFKFNSQKGFNNSCSYSLDEPTKIVCQKAKQAMEILTTFSGGEEAA